MHTQAQNEQDESSKAVCLAAGALALTEAAALFGCVSVQQWLPSLVHAAAFLPALLFWATRAEHPRLRRPWLLPSAVLLQVATNVAAGLWVAAHSDQRAIFELCALLPGVALLCAALVPCWTLWDRGVVCALGAFAHAAGLCVVLTLVRGQLVLDAAALYLAALLAAVHAGLRVFAAQRAACTWAASIAALLAMAPVAGMPTTAAAEALPALLLTSDTLLRASHEAKSEAAAETTTEKEMVVTEKDNNGGNSTRKRAVAKVTKHKSGTTRAKPASSEESLQKNK